MCRLSGSIFLSPAVKPLYRCSRLQLYSRPSPSSVGVAGLLLSICAPRSAALHGGSRNGGVVHGRTSSSPLLFSVSPSSSSSVSTVFLRVSFLLFSRLCCASTGGGGRWLRPTRGLYFGAGGTKGGVKRVSTSTGCEDFKAWSLSERARQVVAKLHHVLVPEYLIRLHHKRLALEQWQETHPHAVDPSGAAEFVNPDGSPFDYTAWNRKYREELDTAETFSALAQQLEETLQLLERCQQQTTTGRRPTGVTTNGAATEDAAEQSTMSAAEKKELLPLVEQDMAELVIRLTELEPEVARVMRRRLHHADVLGSSTSTWRVAVMGKAGGIEAGLFAVELAELLKAYCHHTHGWSVMEDPAHQNPRKGDEEPGGAGAGRHSAESSTTAEPADESGSVRWRVRGEEVYRYLHHEIGVHKVQRVPVTDAAGKMQTSTAVVKLTPVLNPVSVQVYEKDCKIDFVRGSGPGGQGMQSSSNCVVLTHLPSGISVKCHQSRSALGNKEMALEMVAQQLLQARVREQNSSENAAWEQQWSSGERSDKMRTYNFPQNRVTDHRLGRDFPLQSFMDVSALRQKRRDSDNEASTSPPPTTGLLGLHEALNELSDGQQLSTTLLKHIQRNFGSQDD